MKKEQSNIKCTVTKCKFNNNNLEHCELDEIEIGCNCNKENCDCKEKTICNSYKERK